MYFHNSLIPRDAFFFFFFFFLPLESKQEAIRVKLHKMHFRGQCQSIKSEKYMLKWAYPPLKRCLNTPNKTKHAKEGT